MPPPRKPLFDRHPGKTFLCFYIVLVILIELSLKSYFKVSKIELHDPFGWVHPGAVIFNEFTHHAQTPNMSFVRYPGEYDSFEPALFETNSQGIRGPEIGPKKSHRILIVGDSFIEADEVIFEKTFYAKLAETFKNKIEFIAHGVSSWAPTPEFSWIHHFGIVLEPDEVYLFLVFNDFRPAAGYVRGDETYRNQAVWKGGVPVRFVSNDAREAKKAPFVYSVKKVLFHFLNSSEIIRLGAAGYERVKEMLSSIRMEGDVIRLFALNSDQWPQKLKYEVDQGIEVVRKLDVYLKARKINFYVTLVPNGLQWPDELIGTKKVYLPRLIPSGMDPSEVSVSEGGLEEYLSSRFRALGIEWFSLFNAFDAAKKNGEGPLYNELDGHWNWRGHQVVFDLIKRRHE